MMVVNHNYDDHNDDCDHNDDDDRNDDNDDYDQNTGGSCQPVEVQELWGEEEVRPVFDLKNLINQSKDNRYKPIQENLYKSI